MLIAQAARLTDIVSEYDGIAGRLGGDEFLVLLPRVEDEATLRKITNRMVGELAEPVPASKGSYQVGVSIGGVLTRPDVPALKLLNDADAALYEAKKQGRGHSLISDQRLRDQILEAEQLNRDVLLGLENQQFTPWFQPIWGDGGATLAGMEALARWQHPERGLVSPGVFLPVAEEANMLSRLDRLMFEQVCRQVVLWREAGLELDMVHYNMSTAWLEEPDFVAETARILDETGCPPEAIVAEVTESGLMTDISSNSHRLQELRESGIRIAVDDFGQGYSSLAYLSDLPVDLLKIDRRFVDRIDQEESNQAIVSAVVNLDPRWGCGSWPRGWNEARSSTTWSMPVPICSRGSCWRNHCRSRRQRRCSAGHDPRRRTPQLRPSPPPTRSVPRPSVPPTRFGASDAAHETIGRSGRSGPPPPVGDRQVTPGAAGGGHAVARCGMQFAARGPAGGRRPDQPQHRLGLSRG